MGYYTTYKLEWEPESSAVSDFIRQKQAEDGGQSDFAYGITPDGEMTDSVKWYDHEQDMKVLSEQFPTLVFTLAGNGEESGDIWKKYFKNGLVQEARAEIVFAPFDLKKLKKIETR